MSGKLGMRYLDKQGWWYRATDEQRLAQVDAGIELGMTSRQVALVCGAKLTSRGSVVGTFANKRGRRFPEENTRKSVAQAADRRRAKTALAAAYFRGERVDFSGSAEAHHSSPFEELILE